LGVISSHLYSITIGIDKTFQIALKYISMIIVWKESVPTRLQRHRDRYLLCDGDKSPE